MIYNSVDDVFTANEQVRRRLFARVEAAGDGQARAPEGGWSVAEIVEHLSIAECLQVGLPGAHVLGGPHDEDTEERDSPEAMFPDGNSSIARLIVRSLIPAAIPGVTAGADPFDSPSVEVLVVR